MLKVDDPGPRPEARPAVAVQVPPRLPSEELGVRRPHQVDHGDRVLAPVKAPHDGIRPVPVVGATEGAEGAPDERGGAAVGATFQAAVEVERVIVRLRGPLPGGGRGRSEGGSRWGAGAGASICICPPAAHGPVLVPLVDFKAHDAFVPAQCFLLLPTKSTCQLASCIVHEYLVDS